MSDPLVRSRRQLHLIINAYQQNYGNAILQIAREGQVLSGI